MVVSTLPSHLLFVYGSLKRGHRHHAELERGRFVRTVVTAAAYRLLLLGDYPALTCGSRPVCGELYEVDDALLSNLDAFEGDGYRRGWVELSDGGEVQTYFAASASTCGALELSTDEWLEPRAEPQRRASYPDG